MKHFSTFVVILVVASGFGRTTSSFSKTRTSLSMHISGTVVIFVLFLQRLCLWEQPSLYIESN